jgi:hypothetical protein
LPSRIAQLNNPPHVPTRVRFLATDGPGTVVLHRGSDLYAVRLDVGSMVLVPARLLLDVTDEADVPLVVFA